MRAKDCQRQGQHKTETTQKWTTQARDYKKQGLHKSETTQNTDGVWLAQVEPDGYPMGIFIPVHDDGGIGIFSIEKLFEELKLKCK